jgi:hypothetical protein
MAAGTGYWASLLRAQGVDVLCYDRNPPGQPGTGENHFHAGATCWTEVLQGDDSAIDLHPHRTLLLCWPPPNSDMPISALTRYRGTHFVYIGELPEDEDGYLYFTHLGKPMRKGVTTSPQFFAELRRDWDLLERVELPHWEICLDNLYVFRRKPGPQLIQLRSSKDRRTHDVAQSEEPKDPHLTAGREYVDRCRSTGRLHSADSGLAVARVPRATL